jgi:hypothetical protein
MELLAQIAPLPEAVKKFGERSVVGSKLRTAEWEKVPVHLRERALFSAGIEHARFLGTVQQKMKDAIALEREKVARGEAIVDRSSFIGDLRRLAIGEGLGTGKGGLTDPASRTRLGLIFDMQLRMAQGFAQRKMDLDSDVLDAFPAQELVREEDRKMPRDWESRWTAAGGELTDGRMVALKTDPVWTKISRFGTPWPPFDFGSGMGLNDISRDEAEQLGLIEPGAPVEPGEDPGLLDNVKVDVGHMDRELIEQIELLMGDKAVLKNQEIRHTGVDAQYKTAISGGLEPAREWRIEKEPPQTMDAGEARRLMTEGFNTTDQQGVAVKFTGGTLRHWDGYKDEALRPAYLPWAVETVKSPREVWHQQKQTAYLQAFAKPQGGYRGCAVFVDNETREARTFFLRSMAEMDKCRKGLSVVEVDGS